MSVKYTADSLLEVALGEIGYLEKASNSNLDSKTGNAGYNNYTKYARDLAQIPMYNGNKNGYEWCDVFNDWCHYQAALAAGGTYRDAQAALNQPDSGCGAGCDFSYGYYKSAGRVGSTPKKGAQIFFQRNGEIVHTGIVIDYDSDYVYTVEGNTSGASGVISNGGGVCRKTYSRNSDAIYGYGYPDYGEAVIYEIGWKHDANGWWYVYDKTGNYYKGQWAFVGEKFYYFDSEGYVMTNGWQMYNGQFYYCGADGEPVRNKALEINAEGKLVPVEKQGEVRYYKLREVKSEYYRPTLDKLIKKGILKGKGGEGDDLIIDMSEDSVRLLVILDRAGHFGPDI